MSGTCGAMPKWNRETRMTELAHVNRHATTGELSSSIAHELNQPLGSILTNAETAELILKSESPDLGEIREILADIKRDDQRAGEVIRRLRGFLKRTPFETREIDLNQIMGEVVQVPLGAGRRAQCRAVSADGARRRCASRVIQSSCSRSSSISSSTAWMPWPRFPTAAP